MSKCPEEEVEKRLVDISTQSNQDILVCVKSLTKGVDHLETVIECLEFGVVDDERLGELSFYVLLHVEEELLDFLD